MRVNDTGLLVGVTSKPTYYSGVFSSGMSVYYNNSQYWYIGHNGTTGIGESSGYGFAGGVSIQNLTPQNGDV